jgi:hypothetical protein
MMSNMSIEDELSDEPEDRLPLPGNGDSVLIAGMTEHFEKILGPVRVVFHETDSTFVHVDIHQIEYEEGDDAVTYFTTGMGEHPMNVPPEVEDPEEYRYAELVMHMPPEYPRDLATLQQPQYWWPFNLMQSLARIPHERESWVWGGHTIRNNPEADPLPGDSAFAAALVCPSYLLPDDEEVVELPDGRRIVLLTIAFIYAEEYEFCLTHGSEAFFDHLENSGLSPFDFLVFNPERPNTCQS